MIPSPARAGFELVVFDWDGTLMDSIGTIIECTMDAFGSIPGLVVPPREHVREAIGMGMVESIELFYPEADVELGERIYAAYRDRWRAEYRNLVAPIAGALELVEELHGAGYRIGVATAKGRAGLERELVATRLDRFVAASRTIDEAPSKPAPGMLLGLFDELGVGPERTLMVGDTTFDLDMAANAGCAAIGVLSGGHPRERLERSRPLACLPDVTHLPTWFAARAAETVAIRG